MAEFKYELQSVLRFCLKMARAGLKNLIKLAGMISISLILEIGNFRITGS